MDDQDFRGWRFESLSKEMLLERRVKELEDTVARLERDLRRKQLDFEVDESQRHKTIGGMVGTLASRGPVLPQEPHKAD